MAGVAAASAELLFFLPHHEEEEEDVIEDVITAVDSLPFWPSDFDQDEIYGPDPFSPDFHDFPPSQPSLTVPILISDSSDEEDGGVGGLEFRESASDSDFFDSADVDEEEEEEDQVSLVFDLFDRCPLQIEDADCESVVNPFAEMIEGADVMVGDDDLGEEFFVGRRSDSDPGGSSGVVAVEADGLRVVGIESDTDSEGCPMAGANWNSDAEDAPTFPLCWDCLRLEDRRETVEDFEWEEVDEGAVDERDPLSMVIDPDLDARSDLSGAHSDHDAAHNLDWEVLLAVNRLERTAIIEHDAESYLGRDDEYIYTTEYEVLFGQFAEADNLLKGSPPAAKSVVENLPSVVLTKEDVEKNNAICAVCKDGISLEEQVKRLPCSHHYHGDCILPWLHIRNTCPVCRHELPTDDIDYERWRAEREVRGGDGDSRARYEFEMFPEL
ncbi:hypothetical protein ACLOJK_031089 [Asimina triloba]